MSSTEQPATPDLSPEELERYHRHIIMPEIGRSGQKKLRSARVLIVGAGGLGSPSAMYLAAAGVGTLGLVDDDVVDVTNLQRQVLYTSEDIGRPKVEVAAERLAKMNPFVAVRGHRVHLSSENAMEIIAQYDLVIDGTDNFPTRYLVNDACVLLEKPNVYGSIFRVEGQVSLFHHAGGPCYRCLYAIPPPPGMVPGCSEAGVLGILPGLVGCLQAAEAVKVIIGAGETLSGRLLLVDSMGTRFREMKIRKDPGCPVCGENRTISRLIDYEEFCGVRKAREGADDGEITVKELRSRLAAGEDIYILDVREQEEYDLFNINGHLIPLHLLPLKLNQLDPAREIVVHCRTGARSAVAAELLRKHGFAHVRNLRGGTEAWRREIEIKN